MAEPIRPTQVPTQIEALIEGGVSGQVAVGNYNVQIHADHGAVVHFVPPDRQPRPSPRPGPAALRPRPFRGLLDRREDLGAVASALQDGLPVELHGPPGIGKSSLLRHLSHNARAHDPQAHDPQRDLLPDGVVHLAAQGQPATDLLQSLFEAFYECDRAFKPTDVQVRHLLQGRRALVLLDDVALGREEAEALLDAAPGCSFILASEERCLWGEARAVALGGLPTEDSLTLFERELGRPLTAEERSAAADLCSGVECHPLRVLQAAALAKEGKRSLTELAAEARSAPSPGVVNRWAVDQLSAEERRVVAILAGAEGAPLGLDPLREIAGPDTDRVLDRLLERKVVQAHSPRYSLRVELDEAVRQAWQVELWREKLWERLINWAERHPGRVPEEAASLRQAVESAAAAESWETVRRLGRAIEGPLALAGRWGAWGQVIERVLAAAERLRNVPSHAWALHQRGTRALCLGDHQAAHADLAQALQIRESIGDIAGAAVTRHNLGLLLGPPPISPNNPAGPAAPGPRGFPRLLAWLILPALLILLALVVGGRALLSRPSTSDPEPAAENPVFTEESDPGEESLPQEPEEEEPVVDPSPTSTPLDEPVTIDLPVIEVPGDLPTEEETPVATTEPEPPEPVDTPEPEPVEVPEELLGWCCIDGRVFETSEGACQERQGAFFKTRRNARLACAATRQGCCVDGVFQVGMSADECGRLEGIPMTPIEAPFRCKPPEEPADGEGWCCINQDVFPSSAESCKRNGGGFGRTERQALRRCTTQGGGEP